MNNSNRLNLLLKKVSFFSSLSDEALKLLEENTKPVSFKHDHLLCSEGDPGDCMYLIDEGTIHVLKKGKTSVDIKIAELGAGDVAGMMALFDGEPRSATMRTSGDVSLWKIDRAAFRHLIETHPAVSKGMLSVLSCYLRRESSIVTELRSRDEENRLKVAVFDSKPYVEQSFTAQNDDRYALKFFDARLSADTAVMADGFKVVCTFVNDQVDRKTIEELGKRGVQMLALRCAGYNNVDLEACRENNISVARVPAYSPHSVAEHAVALMMALNRHIHRANNRIREGNFSLNGLVGFDMHEKTVGIVGAGKIGQCAIDILVGFGCRVLVYSRTPKEDERASVTYVSFDELLRRSDIISLHLPLNSETHYLINAENIEKMKTGVMLINTSRGGLVNTLALIEALKSGKVGSTGLDVYEEESGYFFEDCSDSVIADDVLARLTTFNNVMVTSHMAFLTKEALANIADTTLDNIKEFEDGTRGDRLTNAI